MKQIIGDIAARLTEKKKQSIRGRLLSAGNVRRTAHSLLVTQCSSNAASRWLPVSCVEAQRPSGATTMTPAEFLETRREKVLVIPIGVGTIPFRDKLEFMYDVYPCSHLGSEPTPLLHPVGSQL
jgi:hypothetical protein